MSLPVVTYKKGSMIVTHPTGVIEFVKRIELEGLRDVQIDEMNRMGKQIEDTNLQISKLSLSE